MPTQSGAPDPMIAFIYSFIYVWRVGLATPGSEHELEYKCMLSLSKSLFTGAIIPCESKSLGTQVCRAMLSIALIICCWRVVTQLQYIQNQAFGGHTYVIDGCVGGVLIKPNIYSLVTGFEVLRLKVRNHPRLWSPPLSVSRGGKPRRENRAGMFLRHNLQGY